MPRPKKQPDLSEIKDMISGLTKATSESIKDLSGRLSDLEHKKEEIRDLTKMESAREEKAVATMPVPPEYREIINTVLNQNFGIQITHRPDGMIFTIVVPDEYSSLKPEEKKLHGADMRTRVIPYHEKENGVRIWAETVGRNFTPDVQAKITAERLPV